MRVFDHPEFDAHESIHHFFDPDTGLKAVIAIHSTALGPAAGGCRRWTYANDEAALTDALRLSRGMSYKNAVAELPFGGGKAVISAPEGVRKTPALFAAFGQAVDSLGGRYVTAEDVGVSVDDMRAVRGETRYVSGLPRRGVGAGGDPSPWTALGVHLGIRAATRARLSRSSLEGLRIAIQGVGNVGRHLAKRLAADGADLVVADVNRDNLDRLLGETPATVVPVNEILSSDVDLLAPCALGNVLTSSTIPKIRAKIVAGAANNQLATPADGERLAGRKILYAPDYVINAGGIISVAHEYLGASSEAAVRDEVARIEDRLAGIFETSRRSGRPTDQLADDLARRILARARGTDRASDARSA